MGPFPISKQGNKYILVLVDQFSKWTECYPLPDQTAESIASVLVKDFIAHFGVPLEIHTDQGRNFDGDLMKQLAELIGWETTKQLHTIPPQMSWWRDLIGPSSK